MITQILEYTKTTENLSILIDTLNIILNERRKDNNE